MTEGWFGDGNIDEDPMLEADGYHLMPDLPCKGMADPLGDYNDQVDIDCKPRVVGSGMDIGCDEFLMIGDLDYDDYVSWEGYLRSKFSLFSVCVVSPKRN